LKPANNDSLHALSRQLPVRLMLWLSSDVPQSLPNSWLPDRGHLTCKDGEKRAGFSSEETGGAEGILPRSKPILYKGRTILHFLASSTAALPNIIFPLLSRECLSSVKIIYFIGVIVAEIVVCDGESNKRASWNKVG